MGVPYSRDADLLRVLEAIEAGKAISAMDEAQSSRVRRHGSVPADFCDGP